MEYEIKYQVEELLQIIEKLSRHYTSFESSSIPYETAQMLMGAVLYCINECCTAREDTEVMSEKLLPVGKAYELGYKLVEEKIHRTKQIYEQLIQDFEDYECRNYWDTVINGLPKFFLYYDPKFQPQNHILTLDYETLEPLERWTGIDKIYRYVSDIKIEKKLLEAFEPSVIRERLDDVFPDYQELYMDNICTFVLCRAVACILADRPVMELNVKAEDRRLIKEFCAGDTLDQAEAKVHCIINVLEERLAGQKTGYFAKISRDVAVRLLEL